MNKKIENESQEAVKRTKHNEWQRRNRAKTYEYQRRHWLKKAKEELLNEYNLPLYYLDAKKIPAKGVIIHIDDNIGIFINEEIKGTEEELKVIAHEIGHYLTNTLHTVDTNEQKVSEHEKQACEMAKNILSRVGIE